MRPGRPEREPTRAGGGRGGGADPPTGGRGLRLYVSIRFVWRVVPSLRGTWTWFRRTGGTLGACCLVRGPVACVRAGAGLTSSMPNTPTEVIDGAIWLGPAPVSTSGDLFDGSSHLATLQAAGITHVVNCTPDMPFITAEQVGQASTVLGEFRVAVPDEDGAADEIAGYFDPATEFIDAAVKAGGKVYVHCETGKSRSATIVLGYRVKCRGESLRAAYDDTKARRDYIQPKPAFFNKLAAEEERIAEASSFPKEEYALLYLLDHFMPYAWVEGISEESIRAAVAEAGGDSTAAHAHLMAVVQAGM